jgi:hypothetical protein
MFYNIFLHKVLKSASRFLVNIKVKSKLAEMRSLIKKRLLNREQPLSTYNTY